MAVHENVGLDLHLLVDAAFDRKGPAVDRGSDPLDRHARLALSLIHI